MLCFIHAELAKYAQWKRCQKKRTQNIASHARTRLPMLNIPLLLNPNRHPSLMSRHLSWLFSRPGHRHLAPILAAIVPPIFIRQDCGVVVPLPVRRIHGVEADGLICGLLARLGSRFGRSFIQILRIRCSAELAGSSAAHDASIDGSKHGNGDAKDAEIDFRRGEEVDPNHCLGDIVEIERFEGENPADGDATDTREKRLACCYLLGLKTLPTSNRKRR